MKLFCRRACETRGLLLLISLLVTLMPQPVPAQSFSPFSTFTSLTTQQLATFQMKLTYLGIQNKGLASLGYSVTGTAFDLGRFEPFYRPGFAYSNDMNIKTFVMSTTQAQAIITQVGQVPAVTAGGVSSNAFVSFSMSALVNGQNRVFESIVDPPAALQLFAALRTALQTVPPLLSTLSIMACPTGLNEPGTPLDVTSSASVAFSGVRLDRATGQFVGTATVKNTGSSAMPTPVSLILALKGSLKLANASGTTCLINPVGQGFVTLPLTAGLLAPGSSVTVTVRYSNPNQDPIQPVPKLVAGPGSR